MFVGAWDEVCPHDTALQYAKIIGDPVGQIYTFEAKMHGYWSYASDENFMQKLVTELQAPAEQTIIPKFLMA